MIGVLPVDKPTGPSSHDIVARARRALGLRRVGHTGTLDPFASGLLLLCLGPATRLAEYLTGLDKTYHATARLGVRTDTLDPTGEVVARSEAWEGLSAGAVRAAFEEQAGRRNQRPPAYSAKKIAGRRAYDLARAGETVEPAPVEVTLHEVEVTRVEGAEVDFVLRVSAGTYVRAVARDAGERLGVGAHLTALRRTAIGRFAVDDAVPADRLEDAEGVRATLVAPLDAVAHLPRIEVDEQARARLAHGQRLPTEEPTSGITAVSHGDELVAMAEVEDRVIRPRKVFV